MQRLIVGSNHICTFLVLLGLVLGLVYRVIGTEDDLGRVCEVDIRTKNLDHLDKHIVFK